VLIEESSNLIRECHRVRLLSSQEAEAAMLINNTVLVVAEDALALFSSLDAIGDPLGNGFLGSVAIPEGSQLEGGDPYIATHRAGFAGLVDGKALLIGLNDVRLFAGPEDALRNRNEIVRLPLTVA